MNFLNPTIKKLIQENLNIVRFQQKHFFTNKPELDN